MPQIICPEVSKAEFDQCLAATIYDEGWVPVWFLKCGSPRVGGQKKVSQGMKQPPEDVVFLFAFGVCNSIKSSSSHTGKQEMKLSRFTRYTQLIDINCNIRVTRHDRRSVIPSALKQKPKMTPLQEEHDLCNIHV